MSNVLKRIVGFAAIAIIPTYLGSAEIVVGGACSLADAIVAANTDTETGGCTAGSGADEIVLTGDVLLTSPADGDTGLPQLLSDITLRGNGFEIRRDPAAPDFRLLATDDQDFFGSIVIEDLTLSGGSLPSGKGGAIFFDSWFAELTLTNVTVSSNHAASGGGIFFEDGYGSIDNSLIVGNSADHGGGLAQSPLGFFSELTIEDSTFSENTAAGWGGGLAIDGYLAFFGAEVWTSVVGSTIKDNTADWGGGIGATGGLFLRNSTVSGNLAETGGGIAAFSGYYHPNRIHYSTLTNNTAATGSGAGLFSDSYHDGEPTVESSVIANNTGDNCTVIDEPLILEGQNFDDDGSCGAEWAFLTGLDPELRDNGGPTETHALLVGSNAIDGADGQCSGLSDQRGLTRSDGLCDAGAFELNAGPLALEGTCPGQMTVSIEGATPSTALDLFQGLALGSSEVPVGPCEATVLQITDPDRIASIGVNADGNGSIVLELTDPDCGQWLQGVTQLDCKPSNVVQLLGCNELSLGHSGNGSNPVPLPDRSAGCVASKYLSGDVITLTAIPDPASAVESWVGTDDDASTDEINILTMPGTEHSAKVNYEVVCWPLTLSRSGEGSRPAATPSALGCPNGKYMAGEVVQLSGAEPSLGWVIGGWTGTDDDSSTDSTNILTMPMGGHTVRVVYEKICFDLSFFHTGVGADPVAKLANSDGCPLATYLENEVVGLTAAPATAWEVGSWSNTDDDGSTATSNFVTMPATDREVGVHYVPTCYGLSLGHTGSGLDPEATPSPDGTDWAVGMVDASFEDVWALHAADMDGDLDFDVVASSTGLGLAWWENLLGDGQSWQKHVVVTPLFLGPLYAADIDGDLDLDLVAADRSEDNLSWWENLLGDGTAWQEHRVADLLADSRSVSAADMDADGDQDILGTAEFDREVWWYENLGGDGSSWSGHLVSDSMIGPGTIQAEDFDGDLDLDVLVGGASGRISWFENVSGDAVDWVEHQVFDTNSFSDAASPADLDGDSDPDVLSTEGWWENLGNGTAWLEHDIGAFAAERPPIAVDFDGDADLDSPVVHFGTDSFSWWENLEGDASSWLEHEVGGLENAVALASADLDGDGSNDLIGGGDSIAWWSNRYGGTCSPGSFRAQDRLELLAAPEPGWTVGGWTGTIDDSSTELANLALMPADEHVVQVHYVKGPPSGPEVLFSGTCPGPIDVAVVNARPNGPVVLYAGRPGGSTEIGGGPCVGTEIGLAGARKWKTLSADSKGQASFDFEAGSAWCARAVQAIDSSCSPGEVADIP